MALTHFLNQTGQLQNQTDGTDRHGNRSFGVARDVRVRAQKTSKTIVTVEREREPIDLEVWFDAGETVAVGDKFTYLGTAYRVMKSSPIVLGNGQIHHTEALMQLWSFGS